MTDPKLKPGSRFCLCRGCGQYFGGIRTFELHRVNFVCVPPEAVMDRKGRRKLFLSERGLWVGKLSKSSETAFRKWQKAV